MLGDFNSPDINWSDLTGQSAFSKALIFRHNLTQHVNLPTHISSSTLDLVLSTHCVSVLNLHTCPHQNLTSDHLPLCFTTPTTTTHNHHGKLPTVSFDFSKADFASISSFLLDYEFSFFYQSTDIEFLWQSLRDIIHHSISLFTPQVRQRPWPHPQMVYL